MIAAPARRRRNAQPGAAVRVGSRPAPAARRCCACCCSWLAAARRSSRACRAGPRPCRRRIAARPCCWPQNRASARPYRYGGTGPDAFDCSGLVNYAHRQLGVTVPRTAAEQFAAATPVPRRDLRPGDLVFFRLQSRRREPRRHLRGRRSLRARAAERRRGAGGEPRRRVLPPQLRRAAGASTRRRASAAGPASAGPSPGRAGRRRSSCRRAAPARARSSSSCALA